MPNDSNRPDVAVFIDFENVYVSVRDKLDANPNFESIMERCEDFGRVVIARAYADWYRYPRVTSALYANGIEPMYVPTYYYDRDLGRTGRPIKNSVDMNLCVEAMKTLYTNPNIAKFVLATGDRDFIPLVNTIRQQGKEVIVIGIGGAASAHLAQSADEFIFYETLVGKKTGGTVDDVPRAKMPEKGRENYDAGADEPVAPPRRDRERDRDRSDSYSVSGGGNGNGNGNSYAPTPPAPTPVPTPIEAAPTAVEPAQPDIYDTLVKAINLARERGYVCSFGSLKLLMKELMGGDFRESRYKDALGRPFAKFKDFVMEAERRGRVQVFTNGTVNEVFLPGEDPYKLSQFAAELKVDPDVSPVVLTEEVAEPRVETKLASSPGNRRRRRRRSGRGTDRKTDEVLAEDGSEDFEEEEFSEALVELADLMDEGAAEEIFEELLDQIESEDTASIALADLDPEPILEPETSQVELDLASFDGGEAALTDVEPMLQPVVDTYLAAPDAAVSDEPATIETMAAVTTTRPFDEQDWQFLRAVLTTYNRPASFAQIHDLLRSARNEASVPRTNEELRTLVKQAINSGILARQGKGNRIAYRVAEPTAEGDSTGGDEAAAPNDQMAQVEEAQVEPQPDEDLAASMPASPETEASSDQMTQIEAAQANHESTGSFLLDSLEDAAELASDPVAAQAEVTEMQQQAMAISGEPDSDISGVASIAPEVPNELTPKRTNRRRKAPATDEAVQTTGAIAAEANAEAAPKQSNRRKQPAKAQSAILEPVAKVEAAPKRTTRRRKPQVEE